jgi:hypothetical protein
MRRKKKKKERGRKIIIFFPVTPILRQRKEAANPKVTLSYVKNNDL